MKRHANMPNYKKIDYRGFIFVVHKEYGMLLLHCTRKPKKGPHYQLPGGHIDTFEFEYAAETLGPSAEENDILLEACKMGAARELYEETGIDVRGQLDRVHPAPLKSKHGSNSNLSTSSNHNFGLTCMLKNKCYFTLNADDDDFEFPLRAKHQGLLVHPDDMNGSHLTLKISDEHSGFIFENDPRKTIDRIQKHSGGTGSVALRMTMQEFWGGDEGGEGSLESSDKNEHGASSLSSHGVEAAAFDNDGESRDLLPPPPQKKWDISLHAFKIAAD
eukprot:CAMPEP_0194086642 /NCGR_PEP_ID=MMETSP0149-20130528/21896_1 /TAXON_ID=122233 /ORGANISM="Chaetoceros debilis, Strain MM31A-1" /LENGTH=273 /DNA_ID=CAMNT_0038769773 /DNA_START=167 /DNA_END=989 /DNA_ORIENTATION=-